MPHLVQMDKRYSKKGLKIIAAECQNSDKAAIGKIVKDHKIEFSVTKAANGPISVSGIPHAVAFGADGKLIFTGHPASEEFEKTIKKALKKVKLEEDSGFGLGAGDLIPQRTWKNSEGKAIVAAVTEIKDDKVTFKLKNGRKIDYAIEKLSEEDQKLIKEKTEEDSEE